jgi:hypothetical protein
MEDPNLIATLIPVDTKKLAENAFRLKHNEARYQSSVGCIAHFPTISSRESTPGLEIETEINEFKRNTADLDYSSAHCIQLTFDKMPKDLTKGFAFGINEQTCDVLLGYRGTVGISNLH